MSDQQALAALGAGGSGQDGLHAGVHLQSGRCISGRRLICPILLCALPSQYISGYYQPDGHIRDPDLRPFARLFLAAAHQLFQLITAGKHAVLAPFLHKEQQRRKKLAAQICLF
jgi:hypothetical protein